MAHANEILERARLREQVLAKGVYGSNDWFATREAAEAALTSRKLRLQEAMKRLAIEPTGEITVEYRPRAPRRIHTESVVLVLTVPIRAKELDR